jgi:hypothetical protein
MSSAKVEAVKAIMSRIEMLGRKFNDSDHFSYDEFKVAHAFANKYEGDFGYMRTMQDWVRSGAMLTERQTAGVLNCLVAEMKRRMAAKSKAAATPAPKEAPEESPAVLKHSALNNLQTGYYTISWSEKEHITLRVSESPKDWKTTALVVGVLTGPSNTSDYTNFGFLHTSGKLAVWKKFSEGYRVWKDSVELLVMSSEDNRKLLGKAFAMRSGRCWRCGRLLTTPESIENGIGPVCKAALV